MSALISNPWARNPWFETVSEAQRRARRRLPEPVYSALIAGSEAGVTVRSNVEAFSDLGLRPRTVGQTRDHDLATSVMGVPMSMPVMISPTGVQAVHPEGEVAVARAAHRHGVAMGLSSFASKPIEDVVAANPDTFFQMYWTGTRDSMLRRMERARAAGVRGLILTTDWSFSNGRDWGSPEIPEKVDLRAALRLAPSVVTRPQWLLSFLASGGVPDLTVPNLVSPGDRGPTFFGAYGEWMSTPPPTWQDISWVIGTWDGPVMVKGVTRIDEARKAVDAGATAISVSNHGGNNLDGAPATIRLLAGIAEAVGDQVEVLLDGGVRRGSDVVKAVALGARAVMIGRAYLWGLAANGQAGVENVLDLLHGGVVAALTGLGVQSVHELGPEHLVVPRDFQLSL
ncbi:mycofactocin system-associated heme/flavin dehydrogenase [Citricoccus sp. SGAir0253]|uniref:pre-mycofactocin synthase MftD n=1 Tax=Citricoccus sp. SGAir0253 TaxID=2567881 RepID=UPI0010CCB24C|nr:pre-mycofactocin synthase MftD [Citricoccus sp. SGAir0253]QCU78899.1 mycofactocin system-associated heme/flavin dehydrogenase [Citricoccus sp. SGAir0253]